MCIKKNNCVKMCIFCVKNIFIYNIKMYSCEICNYNTAERTAIYHHNKTKKHLKKLIEIEKKEEKENEIVKLKDKEIEELKQELIKVKEEKKELEVTAKI